MSFTVVLKLIILELDKKRLKINFYYTLYLVVIESTRIKCLGTDHITSNSP